MTVAKFLGTTEAAARLGVDRSTLVRWAQSGDLTPAYKAPGKSGMYLFSAKDIEALTADDLTTSTS